jgi:hypothetical protein
MQLRNVCQFAASVFMVGALVLASACKKDTTTTTGTSTKCDYAPYAAGSKFVFSTTGTQTATDTILGDTTIGGARYAKVRSTGTSSAGNPSVAFGYIRCDANGVYSLIDRAQVGGTAVTNFTAKEIQSIKLPAAVGTTWKSDTIKYTANVANVAIIYKMTETAVGGTKTINGVAYANGLVTVQIKSVVSTSISGFTLIDSSSVTTNVFDKTYGLIETSTNGTLNKQLKSSIIK